MNRNGFYAKLIGSLLVVVLLTSCAVPSPKKGIGSVNAAIGMLAQGRWLETEEEATRAIDEILVAQRDMKARVFDCKWLSRGTCVYSESGYREKLETQERVIADQKAFRAVARVEMQDYQGARRDADEAIAVIPEQFLAHYALVRVHDHEGNMPGVKRELEILNGSKDDNMRVAGQIITEHYRQRRGDDWARMTEAVRSMAAQLARSWGWETTTITAPLKAAPGDEGLGYVFRVSLPGGWEELSQSTAALNKSLRLIQPVRDYDEVGASITVVPMQDLVTEGNVNLERYHQAFLKNLKRINYDLDTVRRYPEMSVEGQQIAFWIKSPTQSGKELVLEQAKGKYVAVLSLTVLRNYDTFMQRYRDDVQWILSSVSIEKGRVERGGN